MTNTLYVWPTQDFDVQTLIQLHQYATPSVQWIARQLALIGDVKGLALVLIVLLLIHRLRPLERAWILNTLVGTVILNWLIKTLVQRPRPHLYPHTVSIDGSSFPSGHSQYAATLGVLLVLLTWRRPTRLIWLVIGLAWMVTMGSSRMVLAVHYPSDVVGGWLFGIAWAMTCYAWYLKTKRNS